MLILGRQVRQCDCRNRDLPAALAYGRAALDRRRHLWDKKNLPVVYVPDAADRYHYEEDFEEGWEVLRPHLVRERNSMLIDRVKALWFEADPLLRCDICGFSFVEAYGNSAGSSSKPITNSRCNPSKPGSRTKIEDLTKVCETATACCTLAR